MPHKPAHPCAYPNCPALVPYGERFCPEHQKLVDKKYEQNERDPHTRERYGKDWKYIRARQLKAFPLCAVCGQKANIVHHVIPLREGGTNDPANLQSLCGTCHNRLHAKRGDRWKAKGTRSG